LRDFTKSQPHAAKQFNVIAVALKSKIRNVQKMTAGAVGQLAGQLVGQLVAHPYGPFK